MKLRLDPVHVIGYVLFMYIRINYSFMCLNVCDNYSLKITSDVIILLE